MYMYIAITFDVSVCLGGQLSLTCHTHSNGTLLTWDITIPSHSESEIRFFSSIGNLTESHLTVGETVFQFIRTSLSPLMSTMVINTITTSLNGTRVDCYDVDKLVSTAVINVVENGT